MQTHPSLIERSVGATLCAFTRRDLPPEEAELELVEIIASQIDGKTDYAMAVIGFYVRQMLKALSARQMALADAFDAVVDAAASATSGHMQAALKLSEPVSRLRH